MKGRVLPITPAQPVETVLFAVNTSLKAGRPVFRLSKTTSSCFNAGDFFFPDDSIIRSGFPSNARTCEVMAEELEPLGRTRTALLWDASHLWGVMALHGLRRAGFEYELVRSSDVRAGCLDQYDFITVPGGRATAKRRYLEDQGCEAIRQFVRSGGGYLGFCGGAGLALDVPEGLGLLPLERKPSTERLPNFSGSVIVRPSREEHILWNGLQGSALLYVWWPSQFQVLDEDKVEIVCRYAGPGEDLYVADLRVRDIENVGDDWAMWEQRYGINLNPRLVEGEPAIIQGFFGKGRVIVSYPHLETPGNSAGALALFNVWQSLSKSANGKNAEVTGTQCHNMPEVRRARAKDLALKLTGQATDLVKRGADRGLWATRNEWFLLWKRGVKGFQFNTLLVLLKELKRLLEKGPALCRSSMSEDDFMATLEKLDMFWDRFFRSAQTALKDKESLTPEFGSTVVAAENAYQETPMIGDEESYNNMLKCLDVILFELLRRREVGEDETGL